jgi:glycosyltransferase involved in cell wall biosynthesis
MFTKYSEIEEKMQLANMKHSFNISAYPIDMSSLLALPSGTLDAAGVPCDGSPAAYHPTTIAQYALAHWNRYLATNDENHRSVFLTQAFWLVEHEVRISEVASGWPISLPHPDVHTRGSWLSALAQGTAISVLVRAYQLTREEVFLEAVHRAVRTFEQDILDGGVNTPIGAEGIFFEEVAVYPAAHMLGGFILALFGLYDYVALTGETPIEQLIQCSHATMHSILSEFDVGFWTRSDLLRRRLASPAHLTLQAMLLEALAKYSGCDHCAMLALRWKSYQRQFASRLRYVITSSWVSSAHALGERLRAMLFPRPQTSPFIRVCVPINAFPVTGGTQTVLAGVARVTSDVWQLEYLTRLVGPHADETVIHRFGTAKTSPWHFPTAWLYVLAGCLKLLSLMRQDAGYDLILPQDGVFAAAFSALAAKLAGVRVVCIDHSALTLLKSRAYRAEYRGTLAKKHWHWTIRLLDRLLIELYWPSRYLLARISSRFVDHFLAPGIAGDGLEEICNQLGIQEHRVTRFASMIDIDRYIFHDTTSKASIRETKAIAADAIVIALACRLAPEKGIDIALGSISLALAVLSPELRARVRIIIAGDGPLRKQVEEAIHKNQLSQKCLLWGDISAEDVITLLGLSDIFLYTSTRGAYFSMAILEAMASGCAIVASTEPISNAHLLAEGRGIAVPADDVKQTSEALIRLVNDLELCRQMGRLARNYVAVHHTGTMFRRTLMRTTFWSGLDEILDVEKKIEATERKNSQWQR